MGRFSTTQQKILLRSGKNFFIFLTICHDASKKNCCVVANRPIIFFKLLRSGRSFRSTTQQFKKFFTKIFHDAPKKIRCAVENIDLFGARPLALPGSLPTGRSPKLNYLFIFINLFY
uniref:hypothetical protein n=1 Tax=Cephaleuros karstenii TaxID=1985640 RepID=UPI001EE073EE|nr:hypothetical protein MFR52_pgp048 [Cephaleuros karstenii]UIB39111.1 hypothetical protein [Cephaleuros karstenii]